VSDESNYATSRCLSETIPNFCVVSSPTKGRQLFIGSNDETHSVATRVHKSRSWGFPNRQLRHSANEKSRRHHDPRPTNLEFGPCALSFGITGLRSRRKPYRMFGQIYCFSPVNLAPFCDVAERAYEGTRHSASVKSHRRETNSEKSGARRSRLLHCPSKVLLWCSPSDLSLVAFERKRGNTFLRQRFDVSCRPGWSFGRKQLSQLPQGREVFRYELLVLNPITQFTFQKCDHADQAERVNL